MRRKTSLRIEQYDCPSEEQLIRLYLDGKNGIIGVTFDLQTRSVNITHELQTQEIVKLMEALSLGTVTLLHDAPATDEIIQSSDQHDKRLLWSVLSINFSCFLLEIITGILSNSMGLSADALDMLADAAVYGLSIYAIGHSVKRKQNIAKLSGYLQLTLALLGLSEVTRRFIYDIPLPDVTTMISISIIALAGNIASLLILRKSANRQVHFRASIIFTSNDIFANAGIIVAAIFVSMLQSGIPDLIIGSLVFLLVTRGAITILKLAST